MFDTPIQLIGGVATAIVTLWVLWKGGGPERATALASLTAFFITPAVQTYGGLRQPLWGIAAVDASVLCFVTVLLWRYPRRWLIGAWACEALTVLCHAAKLADVTLLGRGYMASLYVLYFGFLAAMAYGAVEAQRLRRSVRDVGAQHVLDDPL